MADDRPVEDPTDTISRIGTDLDDLKSTIFARLSRRPTGDIEPTIRPTPKDNTLLLNGQLVSRTTYPDLWAWAQEQGLVIAGMFTVGDGTTTFGLPSMVGYVPVGAGTLGADTYTLGGTVGASTKALAIANLPSHDHNVSVAIHTDHQHGFTTGSAGGHAGHNSGSNPAPPGSGGGAYSSNSQVTLGAHSHTGTTAGAGQTAHTVTESLVGSGTAFDVRQATKVINWLIWT